jgi:hypothetical protein
MIASAGVQFYVNDFFNYWQFYAKFGI